MKRHLIALSFIILAVFSVQRASAQLFGPENDKSFQVSIGTAGIGADYKYGFTDHIAGRFGLNFVPFKFKNVYAFNNAPGTADMSVQFANVHALFDYTPSLKTPFRIVGGVSYVFAGTGTSDFVPSGTYYIANYTIPASALGKVSFNTDWKGVAPYLGIGFGHTFRDQLDVRDFNINLDIGTYYLSRAKVDVTGTQLLSDNYKIAPAINSNIKDLRWMPVIQVNFNFKLN